MNAKCIKTTVGNSETLNGVMSEYLSVGTLYDAYGIRITNNKTYLYIFNDEHLFEVPIEMFEVIDSTMGKDWKMKVFDNGDVTIWPDLFYQDEFIENFAEREIKERELFKRYREQN
jgi:hypothetical protein